MARNPTSIAALTGTAAANRQIAAQYLNTKYSFLSSAARACVMATLDRECGFNLKANGDKGTAFGAFQHRLKRADNLQSFLEKSGKSFNDITAHIDFSLGAEMGLNPAFKGMPGYGSMAAEGRMLASATTPESANAAMASFERYKDFDKLGGKIRQDRLAATMAYGGAMMGGATYASVPTAPSPFSSFT